MTTSLHSVHRATAHSSRLLRLLTPLQRWRCRRQRRRWRRQLPPTLHAESTDSTSELVSSWDPSAFCCCRVPMVSIVPQLEGTVQGLELQYSDVTSDNAKAE